MDDFIWTDYDGLSNEDIDEELKGMSIEQLIDYIDGIEDGVILTVEAVHG